MECGCRCPRGLQPRSYSVRSSQGSDLGAGGFSSARTRQGRTTGALGKELQQRTRSGRGGAVEVLAGAVGGDAAAGGALDETFLDQERFEDFFDGVAFFGKGRAQGFDADGAAAELVDDAQKVTAVRRIQSEIVNVQANHRGLGDRRRAAGFHGSG